jgi:hypothetical protein
MKKICTHGFIFTIKAMPYSGIIMKIYLPHPKSLKITPPSSGFSGS